MMDETAIQVNNLSKNFKLPKDKQSSIKNVVVNFWRHKKGYVQQQALRDISFEVKKGEFFGIVGRNGSGKSTLLKLIAGIYTPTQGSIIVNGKLTPFIELGVGFNPELTGRENVFLNGALLGFNRKEMLEMYDDIVGFAEIEKFMGQKLKNFSSGMQVRLAFSIAIRAKSDILLLDEVLAVGDEAFQQKCVDVFEEYRKQKQTIVLVTHNMEIVKRFCTRAMLINEGKMITQGEPRRVAREYSQFNDEKIDQELERENLKTKESNINIKILNENKDVARFQTDQILRVEVSWPKNTPKVKNVGISIMKQGGEFMFGANTYGDKKLNITGKSKIVYDVKLSIGAGKYTLAAGIFGVRESEVIDFNGDGPKFIVRNRNDDTSQGLSNLEHKWILSDE
jgi:ABC-2 type transport system ATP-binding protein